MNFALVMGTARAKEKGSSIDEPFVYLNPSITEIVIAGGNDLFLQAVLGGCLAR
ncbi:Uncharacterised protein [Vibrio owensii]|nr:Uncharacterised protein [Vibrio owensii]